MRTHTPGRQPLANNEARTTRVLRNVSPILQKERTSPPREHLSGGPTDPRCSGTIERLAKLLSSTRSSTCNNVVSVDDLISLYKRASRQSLLHYLSAEQMTEVLSICGVLSLQPSPGNASYWPFVLKAAKDKERLSHNLNLQDRYWVMRACLARVSLVESGKILSGMRLLGSDF